MSLDSTFKATGRKGYSDLERKINIPENDRKTLSFVYVFVLCIREPTVFDVKTVTICTQAEF